MRCEIAISSLSFHFLYDTAPLLFVHLYCAICSLCVLAIVLRRNEKLASVELELCESQEERFAHQGT